MRFHFCQIGQLWNVMGSRVMAATQGSLEVMPVEAPPECHYSQCASGHIAAAAACAPFCRVFRALGVLLAFSTSLDLRATAAGIAAVADAAGKFPAAVGDNGDQDLCALRRIACVRFGLGIVQFTRTLAE